MDNIAICRKRHEKCNKKEQGEIETVTGWSAQCVFLSDSEAVGVRKC